MTRVSRVIPSIGLLAVAACPSLGQYVWADDLPVAPAPASPREYLLIPGDTVFVRVFNQENLSGRTKVRPDGRITVPFVNDVEAAGHTTTELAKTLSTMLKEYLNQPVVTVSLEEVGLTTISVLGEVTKPGIYPVERGQGVLRALAAAGGLTDFAHRDRIFVIRASKGQRIRFTLDSLATPGSHASGFRLENDDVILIQ
jgi:polysaccharide biosynthesis/export protein